MNLAFRPYPLCRFGNQLYFALAVYQRNRQTASSDVFVAQDVVCEQLRAVGIKEPLVQKSCGQECICFDAVFDITYHLQQYGVDFKEEVLQSFIKETFLTSDTYRCACDRYRQFAAPSVAISIRNGDYLAIPKYRFNFIKFLRTACANANTASVAYVFSDDLRYCKKTYHNILNHYFKSIIYVKSTTAPLDLLTLAQFETKVIWNSTFGYWSSYIGDVLYPESHRVYVPAVHCQDMNGGKAWQLNPKWTAVEC